MSSPSPSGKSNGSRRRRRRTRSPSASGSTASDAERSQVEEVSTNNAPAQEPSESAHSKAESIHTETAEENTPQSSQPSNHTSGDANIKGVQIDPDPPLLSDASRARPESEIQPVSADNQTPKKDVSESSVSKKVQRVQIEPDRLGWAYMYDLTRKFDHDRVSDIKTDIDDLPVLAGLFSTVVTAFIVESYKRLQQQPDDMTNEILLRVSAQLASLSLNGNLINSTAPSFAPSPFTPTRPTVLINTLWSLSLVIALITAFIGKLVKQWLHELLSYETMDPKERLKLRFFREAGIERWRVLALADSLPLLLQLALLLFFVGLSIFLRELSSIVGWITTAVMSVWLTLFVITTFAPVFSSQCPYKTPLLKQFLYQLRFGYISRLHDLFRQQWLDAPQSSMRERFFGTLRDWMKPKLDSKKQLEEDSLGKNPSLDMPTVICVRDLLRGEKLNDAIFYSFKDHQIEDIIQMSEETLERKLVARGIMPDVSNDMDAAMRDLLGEYSKRVRDRFLVKPSGEALSQDPSAFRRSYADTILTLSKTYVPKISFPVPKEYVSLFIQYIQSGPISAAFAIFTMFSIRHHTMIKHPDSWDHLFLPPESYSIEDQFISNLFVATKTLIHSLWNRQQPESDIQQIADCVAAIRHDAGDSDLAVTPDPIAFIYVFAIVLRRLTPEAVVQKHRERIFEVMGELAEILTDLDGSSWSFSRKGCAEMASGHLYNCYLQYEQKLYPKLRTLIET